MSQPDIPTPDSAVPRKKRSRRILTTALKIIIAIAGLCFVFLNFKTTPPIGGEFHVHLGVYVTQKFHWEDTATFAEGSAIREVQFKEDVLVRVLVTPDERPAGPRARIVRIRFPDVPVAVSVAGQDLQVVIDEETPLPKGAGKLGVPRELDVPLNLLKPVTPGSSEVVSEGIRSLLIQASSRWHLLVCAWALLATPFFVTAIRWRNLMRPQGIDMPLAKCIQLTFVGQFYSILLPGITGGDLVKIVYAARLTGSKTKSFITVILDRVIGLVALMVIAGASAGGQLILNNREGRPLDKTLLNVLVMILIMLGGLSAMAIVYFSHRLRRAVGIEWFVENFSQLKADDVPESLQHHKLERFARVMNACILAGSALGIAVLATLRWGVGIAWAQQNNPIVFGGLGVLGVMVLVGAGGLILHSLLIHKITPVLRKAVGAIIGVDETLHVYRGHFGLLAWSFLISVMSQMTLPLSAWLAGLAFGMNAPVGHYLAYVPLAVLAASLPVMPPQGFGVLDGILYHFFVERGTARAGQAVVLAQCVRFLPILWNLCGVYWVVTGKYSRQRDAEQS